MQASRCPALFLAVALLAMAPSPRAAAQVPGAPVRVDTHQADLGAARLAAESWLGHVDAGEYGQGWQDAAPFFQRTTSEAQLTELLGNVRLPLGKTLSRETLVSKFSPTMPGLPDGAYAFFQFQTEFERKKTAVETVTCLRDTDGRWKVAGFFIK